MAQKDRYLNASEIEEQTKRLAADLAFCARRPVNIQLVGGKHIAYTYDTDKTKSTVPIVMNPSILSTVRNKERAVQIWRGIGFHELAHHLWPADGQYKAAHKEGFRHLFNLVDDEQNERRGRAFDASWGACFQSVCAFIFPGKNQSEQVLIAGIVDGDKPAKAPQGRAAQKTYIKRWNMFAFHLRRHIPDCPDEVVAAALALIPKRFMDLTKDELLDLTRQIHETLARDIVLPSQDPNGPTSPGKDGGADDVDDDKDSDEQDKEPAKPEPEPEKEPEEEPKPEPPAEKDSWSWRKLFRSKWLYLPFGIFAALWFALLLHGGVNFWVKVTVNGAIGLGVVTAFLFLRRAYIKALLARAKAAVVGGAKSGAAAAAKAKAELSPRAKLGIKISLMAILAATGGLLAHRFLPLPIAEIAFGMIISAGCGWLMVQWRKGEEQKDKPLSKGMIAGIAATGLASLGLVVFGCHELGLGNIWLSCIAGFLLLVLLAACFIMFGGPGGKESQRLSLWGRFKRGLKQAAKSLWQGFVKILAAVWKAVWGLITAVFTAIGRFIAKWAVKIWNALTIAARRTRWKLSGPLTRAWRNPILRVALVAFPAALILVIIYALLTKAGSYGWWVALLLALLLLAGFILGWIFRKKIKRFIVDELFMPMPALMDASMQAPLDMVTEWFNQVDNVVPVEPDHQSLDALLPQIYPLAQQLRPLLAKCGRVAVDREDQPEGYDLTDEAELALIGETSIFVNDDSVPKASVHLEVALDCSGSMAYPTISLKPGEKFLLGKFFALVLEQAVLNLPGVSAHFWGFTNDTIYDCGTPGEGRISGLRCGGGNNDSAMLWHMGQSAAASGKDVKILLMLSDGQPSECSWLSLHNLVLQFEQEGMIPWNFALDVINTPAFERFFTDLVGQTMEEAIGTMGETLAALAADGI